jgi:hypothetical protein
MRIVPKSGPQVRPMKSVAFTTLAAAIVVAFASGGETTCRPVGPMLFGSAGNRVTVKCRDFTAIGDQIESDPTKNTIIVTGREGEPASLKRLEGSSTTTKARRITFNYVTSECRVEGGEVVVPLDQIRGLRGLTGQPLRNVSSSEGAVLRCELDKTDPTIAILTPLRQGMSRVRLTDANGTTEERTVYVE